jgi:hypothetical protein
MCKEIREKFQTLYSLNVNQYVEKKQGLSYLSWSYAWAEFKKVYPDATYDIKKDEQGRCYFGDPDIGYMVYTSVSAGGLTYEMWLPVMDNANKSMKLNAYTYSTRSGDKTVEAISSFDINKTVMRCLVKNLSMFGLGLYIYSGEDLPEDIREFECADCGKAVDANMAQRTQNAFGVCLCKDCGIKRSKANENKEVNNG